MILEILACQEMEQVGSFSPQMPYVGLSQTLNYTLKFCYVMVMVMC